MADRAEFLEAALDVYPQGLALLDQVGRAVYWNRTAELITGHCSVGIVGRELPQGLEPLMCCGVFERQNPITTNGIAVGKGTLVHAQHQRGHDVPAVARKIILRDALGARIGVAVVFHPAERKSALPHGDTSEGSEVKDSQADLRERIEFEFERFVQDGVPLGLMWIAVDQAGEMRRTHGARACEAMLENMERTLANNLRPG
ncbi:MAG TPA: PAS domain S-box protein, partial [Terracidiphilus sp.]